jgi:voltage-gated potassium channel
MAAGVGLFGTFTGFVSTWFLVPEAEEQEIELHILRAELARVHERLDQLLARHPPA